MGMLGLTLKVILESFLQELGELLNLISYKILK